MSVTGGAASVTGGGGAPPAMINVGAANSDGTLRLWLAQQAVEKGEAILSAQLSSVGRLSTSATSILGWSVTIALTLIAGISSALTSSTTATTANTVIAISLVNLLWPGIAALAANLIAAICCVVVLWPGYWQPPGHASDLILNAPYDTELEVLEALAAGYADAMHANAAKLNRLEKRLRAAWVFFVGAPLVGVALYSAQSFGLFRLVARLFG